MKNPFRNLQKWLMVLTIMTFSAVAFLAMSGTVFAGVLTPVSTIYTEPFGAENGTVDIIRIDFADVTACAYEAGDWLIIPEAGSIGVTAVTGIGNTGTCAVENFVLLNVTTSPGVTGGVTNPQITYSNLGTAGSLAADANTDTTTFTALDAAKPVIKTVTIADTGTGDGLIDSITLTWTEAVDTDDGVAPVEADLPATLLPDGETANFASAVISDPAGASAVVTITGVTGQIIKNTAAGATAISGDLSALWKDAAISGNAPHATTGAGNESVVDLAGPVIKTVTIEDTATTDGKIDKITYTWSENIDTNDGVAPVEADLPTTLLPDGSTAVFTSAVISDPAGAAATVVVTGITGQTTANTAAGSTAISGDLSAMWKDGSSNTPKEAGGTGNESVTDSAAPYVTALVMYDASSDDGIIDKITLTYSESLADTAAGANGFDLANEATHGTCDAESANPSAATTLDLTFTCTSVNTSLTNLSLAFTANAGIVDSSANQSGTKTFTSASTPAFTDGARPIAVSVTLSNASNKNKIAIVYSEPIAITLDTDGYVDDADLTSNESMTSTASVGGIDSAGSIERIGNFGTTGNVTQSAETNNTLAISADGLTLTVTLNSATGAYFTAGTTEPSVSFSVDAWAGTGVDLIAQVPASIDGAAAGTAQKINNSHSVSSIVGGDTWDLTPPSTITYFRVVSFTSALTGVNLEWTAHSTLADWSRYMFAYGTSAGVGLSSSLWTSSNDENLTTITQQSTRITGLTQNSTYYTKAYAIDIEGNVSTGSTETNFTLSSYTGDSGAPTSFSGVATNFKVSVNENLKTVLTWKDPVESGFDKVQIYRAKGGDPAEYSLLATVSKWLQTYTDTDVNGGEVVNYKLKAIDENGYAGEFTNVQTITVGEGEESVTTEETTTEESGATIEEGAVEEEPAVEPITVTTESGATVTLDDVTGHWAEDEITAMAEQEIVEGDEDGNFNPNSSLNRAEAAAILYRVLGLEEPTAPEEAPFTDVAIDAWYAGYVANLKSLNLVSGQTETTYGPALPINRAEFLNLAVNAYNFLAGTTTPEDQVLTDAFSDLDTEAWYAPVVSEAYGLEFISGSTCATGICFNAGDPITRAEATKILYNMFYEMLTAQTVE